MNIIATESNESRLSTAIIAQSSKQELPIIYEYSHAYGLIHDPFNFGSWMGWNGGSLEDAIKFLQTLE